MENTEKILYIKCLNGFANQLRSLLAANTLVKKKLLDKAYQEWIINNHNVVDYSKFFLNLPHVTFTKIKNENYVNSQSYQYMMRQFGLLKNSNTADLFRESFQDLNLKQEYKEILNNFVSNNNIHNCIGLHLRTGCKTAILLEQTHRNKPIPHEIIIDLLKTTDKKIYLSTDNAETQNKIIDIFKDRVLFFEKLTEGKENFDAKYNKDMVKRYTTDLHVVMDFYILQHCDFFIGSNESSLSLMIKFIRNNTKDYEIHGIL